MGTNRLLRILVCCAIPFLFGSVGVEAAWGQATPLDHTDTIDGAEGSSESLMSYAGERWQRRAEGFRGREPTEVSHTQFGAVTNIAIDHSDNAAMTAGDVNGDGNVDLVVGTRFPSAVTVYLNPGPAGGPWTTVVVNSDLQDTFDVAVADLDGDGDLDLMSASAGDHTISWYENVNGDGATWAERVISTTALGVRNLFPADIDGDGDLDFAAGHQEEGLYGWYENEEGDASVWTLHVVSTFYSSPRRMAMADLDDDGDLDLIVTASGPDAVAWFENTNGLGTAWTRRNIATNIMFPRTVAVGDLDGDGDLDLVSGSRNDDMIAWYESNGASRPRFTMHVLADNPVGYGLGEDCDPCAPECGFADGALQVHVADLDLDGDLDIIVAATHADRIFWYENTAPGAPSRFTARNLVNPGNPRTIVPADIDGDGYLDLAYFNRRQARPGPLAFPGVGVWWVKNVVLPGPGPFFTGECSDGVDNDADCQIDYPADPGCATPFVQEAPACSDHLDNDGDGLIDLDDPGCKGNAWQESESPKPCGLGYELAVVIPVVLWRHRRRRRDQS